MAPAKILKKIVSRRSKSIVLFFVFALKIIIYISYSLQVFTFFFVQNTKF